MVKLAKPCKICQSSNGKLLRAKPPHWGRLECENEHFQKWVGKDKTLFAEQKELISEPTQLELRFI